MESGKKCQAYILALGVNDITKNGEDLGNLSDIDKEHWKSNAKTFVGYYAQIIQRLKEIQSKAKFFLMTIPRKADTENKRVKAKEIHRDLLYKVSELFENTYVIDFRKYAPIYDDDFKSRFYLGTHMNAAGYLLTARMVESYIDYLIRHNIEDFKQVGFIGTSYHNALEKW